MRPLTTNTDSHAPPKATLHNIPLTLLSKQVETCVPSHQAKNGVGVFEQNPGSTLVVRGKDAAPFLHGLTTNHNKGLRVGVWQPNLLCANKGGILYSVEVLRLSPEQFLLYCNAQHMAGIASHLQTYCFREAVEIGQVPMVRVEVLGPQAEQVLADMGMDMQHPLTKVDESPAVVARNPWGKVPRVSVLMHAHSVQAWLQALSQGDAVMTLGPEAIEELRLVGGVPRMGVDYQQGSLPQEAGLLGYLSFRKGCYMGQEIHARLQHRGGLNRTLMAFSMPEDVIGSTTDGAVASRALLGASLYQSEKVVGKITSLTHAPWNACWHGIAKVELKKWDPAQPTTLATPSQAPLSLGPVAFDWLEPRPVPPPP